MEINGPKILFEIAGIKFNETIVNSFMIIVIVFFLCIFLTRKLEKIPTTRRQQFLEKAVTMLDNMVVSTMGKQHIGFAPYILTIIVSSAFGSLISLFGFRSVTADINVTITWALMTFVLIHASGIRAKGLGYFKGFIEPIWFLLPLNIISELVTPISMGFRHFGNIVAGFIITTLIYFALGGLSTMVGLPVPLFQLGVPAVLSMYFDVFSGCMQAYIFSMLTMVFVSNATN